MGACAEQRICELMDDLAADGFCQQQFYATEVAFRGAGALQPAEHVADGCASPGAQIPASVELESASVCMRGARSRAGHTHMLHMSMSWGRLETSKAFMDKTKHWCESIAPRLENATDSPAQNASSSSQN